MLSRRQITLIVTALVALAVLYWLSRNYSPYQICLRHSEAEAFNSGMTRETARQYAIGLCKSKIPLVN